MPRSEPSKNAGKKTAANKKQTVDPSQFVVISKGTFVEIASFIGTRPINKAYNVFNSLQGTPTVEQFVEKVEFKKK